MLSLKTMLRSRILPCMILVGLLVSLLPLSGCSASDEEYYDFDQIFESDTNAPADDDADPEEGPDFDWAELPEDPDGAEDPGSIPPETAPELDFVVKDLEEPLPVDTYLEYMLGGERNLTIYDRDYLDLFFDPEPVPPARILRHIEENPNIPEQYRELLTTYVNSIVEKYPEADLRPLDYNLQSLEVVECDEFELALHAISMDAYGCYVASENKIYVPQDYTYRPGTWEYQVIMHEFGHAARTVDRVDGNTALRIDFQSDYLAIPEEALNSIFTVSLFDYEERDIAYQLQSNMMLILTDCCEGYSLADYLNHSLSYFLHMLDLQNGDTNYAMSIMKLMDEQRSDWADSSYERPQEFYHPLYDYLTKMYLDQYASAGMDEAQIDELVDQLLEVVLYDVPPEYHVDTEEFYRFAHTYQLG